jgi:hypothetical protein
MAACARSIGAGYEPGGQMLQRRGTALTFVESEPAADDPTGRTSAHAWVANCSHGCGRGRGGAVRPSCAASRREGARCGRAPGAPVPQARQGPLTSRRVAGWSGPILRRIQEGSFSQTELRSGRAHGARASGDALDALRLGALSTVDSSASPQDIDGEREAEAPLDEGLPRRAAGAEARIERQ